jgi:hypothetical protein
MNVDQFNMATRVAERAVVSKGAEMIRAVALELYSSLQTDARTVGGGWGSPVASGRLASSMRLGINQVDTSYEPEDTNYEYPDGKGERELPPRTIPNVPISRIAAQLREFKLGDTIYISNSVPYIRKIEIGGHSWQTPDGVFNPTVREIMRKFDGVAVGVSIG